MNFWVTLFGRRFFLPLSAKFNIVRVLLTLFNCYETDIRTNYDMKKKINEIHIQSGKILIAQIVEELCRGICFLFFRRICFSKLVTTKNNLSFQSTQNQLIFFWFPRKISYHEKQFIISYQQLISRQKKLLEKSFPSHQKTIMIYLKFSPFSCKWSSQVLIVT